jgi:hypothetical protein
MRNLSRPAVRRTILATASVGATMALLAACGNGSTAAASSSPATNNSTGTGSGAAGQGAARTPGVSGQIAAVSGKTLQVQGASSQTAVTYTTSTAVSQIVSAKQSDLAVGKCVSVTPVQTGATGATGAAPDMSAPITAASVSISDAVNGSCMRGAGGMGGGLGGGHRGGTGATGATGAAGNFTPPAGATGATGARGGFGGGGFGANGTVASISGDTMTVTMTQRTPGATGATGAAATTTVTRTVTLNSSTTYTETQKAADSALTVGKCVSAIGSTDSTTGAVTANSITIRPAVNGSCSTGFGGRGNRGAGAGAGAAGAGANGAALGSEQ